MDNFIKFVIPFILGIFTGFLTVPELQRLSVENYEQKITDLSEDLAQCHGKVKQIQEILK
jgi:hypothetical protein